VTITTTPLRAAADRLIAAAAAPRQCDPVRDILGDNNIASAYAVQRTLTEDSLARGRRIVGHKIGLTSPAVQRQRHVDQPDSGVLFADMRVATGGTVATGTLLQPKVEAALRPGNTRAGLRRGSIRAFCATPSVPRSTTAWTCATSLSRSAAEASSAAGRK
jgi:hypothetical protein